MISWLNKLRPAPDHPMRDVKAAQTILDQLPRIDPHKYVLEVAAWIESVTQASGFRLSNRAAIIRLLDEAGYPLQRKLQQEYLPQNRQSRLREQAVWKALVDYWRALVNAYLFCLDASAMNAREAESVKPALPLLCARALHAAGCMYKTMLLHYGPVDDSVWHGLSRIWLFVEGHQLQDVQVGLYPHLQRPTTARIEFTKPLMLACSSAHSLLPPQIDLAERMIDDVASHFVMGNEPDSRSAFVYDLAVPRPPSRLVAGMMVTPRMRFVGPGMASVRLEELSRVLDNPAAVSAAGFSYAASAVSLRTVLQHLLFYWSMSPPERQWPRMPVFGRLTVVHGYANVMRSVLFSKFDIAPAPQATRDLLLRQKHDLEQFGFVTNETQQLMDTARDEDADDLQAENWLVQNVSLGGYGAVLPALRSDWLRVGCLLAVRGAQGDWQIGVVRRLHFDAERQTHVGIEILAARLTPVRIRPASTPRRDDSEEYALLFALSLAGMTSGTLLVRAGNSQPGQTYLLSGPDQPVRVEWAALRERGEEFELVEFRVLSQE